MESGHDMANKKNTTAPSRSTKRAKRAAKRADKLSGNPLGHGMTTKQYARAVRERGYVEATDGLQRAVPSKRAARRTAQAVATRESERVKAFSYHDRRPIIADVLRHKPNRSATVAELFEEVESERFGTPRRLAAMFRYDQRQPVADRMFERGDGNRIRLRDGRAPKSRTKNGRVSKSATRRSK